MLDAVYLIELMLNRIDQKENENQAEHLITFKQQVTDYLEAQRPYYGNEEVEISLEVLAKQNDDLSCMGPLSKTLVIRLIDDDALYTTIESASIEK